jgi:hypothetical protein
LRATKFEFEKRFWISRAFRDYPQDSKARTPSWQDREPVKTVREDL